MLKLLIKVMGKPGRLVSSAADFYVIDFCGIDEWIECLVNLVIHTVNNNCMHRIQLNFFSFSFSFSSMPHMEWRSASVSFKGKKSEM